MESKVKLATAQYRLEKWTNIISERNASGLSIKEWCLNNHVKETAYYYWLRKIRYSIIESFAQQNEKKENIEENMAFVPMLKNALIDNESSETRDGLAVTAKPQVIIRLGEISVEFLNHTSDDLILRILRALKDV